MHTRYAITAAAVLAAALLVPVSAHADDPAFASGVPCDPDPTTPVVAVSAQGYEAAALKADGRVVAWNWSDKYVPKEARSGVDAISVANDHILALKDGRVIAWGRNDSGQLEVPPEAESGVTAIAAGVGSSLAVKDGRVIAWGDAAWWTKPPVEDAVAVAFGGRTAAMVLRKTGEVVTWRPDWYVRPTAQPPGSLKGVDQIAVGSPAHFLAVKNGRVLSWGMNPGGQRVPAEARDGVDKAVGGWWQTVALKGGRVLAWGQHPTLGLAKVPPEATAGVTDVAAFLDGNYAVKDGRLLFWLTANDFLTPADAGQVCDR